MARLGFVWELGQNGGYAALIGQLARMARAQGHECLFLVCDPAVASAHLPPELGTMIQAPLPRPSPSPAVRVQVSYASLLHNCGFANADALAARLRSWRELFRALGIERVAARHSPTAILAARSLGLPLMHYGNRFSIPPSTSPWPSFRTDVKTTTDILRSNEAHLLATMNSALGAIGASPLGRPAAMYDIPTTLLLGYPQTDHYAGSPRTSPHVGLPDLSFGETPQWTVPGNGPRLFVNLLPGPTVAPWLKVLGQLPARIMLRVGGHTLGTTALPAHIQLVTGAVNYREVIASSDVVLGYGSHNLICEAVLAGKPIATMAHNPDQQLIAQRMAAQGLGPSLPPQPDDASAGLLQRWLRSDQAARTAQAIAIDCSDPPREQAIPTLFNALMQAEPCLL
ncbi:hypothetical protein E4T66_10515 [Sinimarinibacterium sp. CAU 1509]|uniref:glycosyltransferase n=1 Tax=Sinimarinibacterium sp. CAU 1509 TaxID=2562283 RepID=UPI0010AD90E0|nr:hypothetical protein [Sinimarinibacterium sp. CAU 1509]TJY61058.1 hypothetical protein E4T66_10515 [Sinimarinibacterium sp. CAU 1509]